MATAAEQENVDKMAAHFKRYIIGGIDPVIARKALTQVYVNYTRYLISDPDNISECNDDQLYVLAEMIEILDGGY